MTYDEATVIKQGLEARCDWCSAVVNTFPHNSIGLTPDHIKRSPEYRKAAADYACAFVRLREFNQRFVKMFAAEIKAARRAKQGQR